MHACDCQQAKSTCVTACSAQCTNWTAVCVWPHAELSGFSFSSADADADADAKPGKSSVEDGSMTAEL